MSEEPISIFDYLDDKHKDTDLIEFLEQMEEQSKRRFRMSAKQCEKFRQLLKERES